MGSSTCCSPSCWYSTFSLCSASICFLPPSLSALTLRFVLPPSPRLPPLLPCCPRSIRSLHVCSLVLLSGDVRSPALDSGTSICLVRLLFALWGVFSNSSFSQACPAHHTSLCACVCQRVWGMLWRSSGLWICPQFVHIFNCICTHASVFMCFAAFLLSSGACLQNWVVCIWSERCPRVVFTKSLPHR